MRFLAPILLVLSLAGCASVTLVEPGPRKVGAITLTTPESWSQQTYGGETVWTYDGVWLNRVSIREIDPGENLLGQPVTDANQVFSFDPANSLEGTLEKYIDALGTAGLSGLERISTRPRFIGEREALDFELSWASEDRLAYRALGTFVRDGETLYRVICSAPAEYYFPRHRAAFDAILASISFQ